MSFGFLSLCLLLGFDCYCLYTSMHETSTKTQQNDKNKTNKRSKDDKQYSLVDKCPCYISSSKSSRGFTGFEQITSTQKQY